MEVDKHFIKETIDGRMIYLPYTLTTEQVTYVLTEVFHKKQFNYLISKLTIKDIFKQTCGGVL
jgi:hypothetical protein